MVRHLRIAMRSSALPLLTVSVMLGGCSVDRFSDAFTKMPSLPSFDWNPYSRDSLTATSAARAAATAADFVSADGSCSAGDRASAPPSGVALQMTECSLVQLLGPPESIDIGTNERGDRSVTMLYTRADRPGRYHFTAGQLTLIERVAEPEPPAKPRKPAPAPKPRGAVT